MKLHGIEVKNLNSLYGDYKIDFHRDLKDAQLFLIVGPTGAGKSTLMDAVCLALFGQTPRLTRERGQEDRDSRMIMSHGTGECLAAIEFSKASPDGKRRRYRAEWSCQRARKKPGAKLQDPQRSLSVYEDDGTRRLLVSDSKAKVVDPCFSEVLRGFTVEDFQRSVLLAQGEFSAFLKATDQQRAAILERLTRTDIYKRLGERTAVLKREHEAALKAVEQQQKGLVLLSPDEVAVIAATSSAASAELGQLDAEIARLVAWEAWLGQLAERRAAQAEAASAYEIARAALADRAPDLARLDEDARCREAGDAWRALQHEQGEVARFTARLLELRRDEEDRRSTLATEAEAASTAAVRKGDADSAQERARPQITAARALRQAWQRAAVELEGAELRSTEATTKVEASRAQLERLTAALTSATARLDAAVARHGALAHAEPLIAQIAGFSARARHLTTARDQRDGADRKQRLAEKEHADLGAQRARLAAQRDQFDADHATLALAHDAAAATLRPLLADSATVKARREALGIEAQSLAKRATASRDARALLVELAAKQGRLAAIDDDRASLAQRVSEVEEAIDRALEARDPLAREAMRCDTRFADWELIRKLSDEREALVAGRACPLCGSLEHPLVGAYGHEAERAQLGLRHEEVKLALESARVALAEHDRQAYARSDELARIATLFTAKTMQRAELAEQAVDLAARAAASRDEAQLPPETSLAAIDAALVDLDARAGAALAARGALDEADEALKNAAEALRSRVEGLARLKANLETLDARVEATKAAVAEQAQLVTSLDAEIAGEITALRADLAERGIAVREPCGAPELTAAIDQARALTQQAQAAAEERRRAEVEERDARSARDLARSQHAQAADRLAEHLDAVTQRRAQVDTAQQQSRACLDGADPDALERSLQAEVDAARLALEGASGRAASSREALAGITAHRQATEAQHAETQGREAIAREALARHLVELSWPDIDSLAERLLTDDARKRLTEETGRAREALVAATATRDDADKRLAAVTTTRPGDAGAEESTSEAVNARRKGLESRSGELHQQVGHCRAQLEEHQRKSKDLAGVLERVDRVRRECEIWRSLHELIGVGDGERFKEFAQILNLQELIDKANARLKWLAPRYSLTVARTPEGLPRLSFAVRDAHFADAERPPTTLSGGETFLVSLALALALADYRAVEMPIETLLLDEGFGTLDNDTLNTAMDALERLQARGTQIGIISHLTGLRERIEARIVVGKLGNGRSEIRFELGTDV